MELTGDVSKNFPSFSEGLSLRHSAISFEQTFSTDFPSFSEGLSLRHFGFGILGRGWHVFPFLFGRAFIEAQDPGPSSLPVFLFPFLFGRAFIEALIQFTNENLGAIFPFLFGRAFIEAYCFDWGDGRDSPISLPFRKGFH